MGRFDALTQIDKKLDKAPSSLQKPANLQTVLPASPQVRKPANPQVGKPVSPQTRKLREELVEKYTTRLTPSMVRLIKIHAVQKDLKDYEVVEKALSEYFERNK